jgi:hypothetical protein
MVAVEFSVQTGVYFLRLTESVSLYIRSDKETRCKSSRSLLWRAGSHGSMPRCARLGYEVMKNT